MLGLYVHVPFCRRRCPYCDFDAEVADGAAPTLYVEAIAREAAAAAAVLSDVTFDTVFLGGGTPSSLPPPIFLAIFRILREQFRIHPDAEITAEANPESLSEEALDAFRAAGVNRISLGVQSFQNRLLKPLGRVHTAEKAEEAWWRARRHGFENLSLDLMFGLPGQTLADWLADVRAAVSWQPEHISAYALTLTPTVPLTRSRPPGGFCDEEEERAMYYRAREIWEDANFDHYEISNFSRPGRACRHNLKYWRDQEYLGLGPSAAGHIAGGRYKNPRGLTAYAAAAVPGRWPLVPPEPTDPYREMRTAVTLALRLLEGLDVEYFRRRFGVDPLSYYGDELTRLADLGLLEVGEKRLRLTTEGLWLSDEVFSVLI